MLDPATVLAARALASGVVTFAKDWWKAGVGAALVAAPVFLLGSCHGADAQKEKDQAALVRAQAYAASQNQKAIVRSDATRVTDQAATAELKEGLSNADNAAPDSRPSLARNALNCERLRRAHRDTSNLPECNGPATPGQARPAR